MPGHATPEAREVTRARREILLGIVRREPGLSTAEILERALDVHRRGEWPEAPWNNAVERPYHGGVNQMLTAVRKGHWSSRKEACLIAVQNGEDWRIRWYHEDDIAEAAQAMLPDAEEARELLLVAERVRRESGRELLFGVSEELEQVVRLDTGRGILEEKVDPRYGWTGALLRIGVIDGSDLVPA